MDVSKVVLGKVEIEVHLREGDQAEPSPLSVPYTLRRRGVEAKLILSPGLHRRKPTPDQALIKVVARAHYWSKQLIEGHMSRGKC